MPSVAGVGSLLSHDFFPFCLPWWLSGYADGVEGRMDGRGGVGPVKVLGGLGYAVTGVPEDRRRPQSLCESDVVDPGRPVRADARDVDAR
jgi:hypothetical protein